MLISVEKSLKVVGMIATIISLSACSSMPRIDAGGMGETVGNTISTVTEKTVEIGSSAYQSTRRFLGFDRDVNQGQDPVIDEVDLALMEDDAMPVNDDDGINVVIQPATVAENSVAEPLLADPQAPTSDQTIVSDYIHDVMPGESLWDIAKATTGDATNWRILAEYNEMPDGTSVYPNQQLVIPADMVKPEIAGLQFVEPIDANNNTAVAATDTSMSDNALILGDSTQDPAPERLKLPELDVTESNTVAVVEEQPAELIEKPKINSAANAIPITVEAGETLWDLAKRSTGDATNWKQIAAHNNFSEEEAVFIRYGQTIYIPNTMAKDEVLAQAGVAPEAIVKEEAPTETVAAAEVPADSTKPVEETLAAVVPQQDSNLVNEAVEASANAITDASVFDETKPIKIVEATYQSDEKLPLPENDETVTAAKASDQSAPQTIMVSGTYYPKAIYNDADFSSSLLKRVSPGTELIVSRAVGSWYEVQTDKGIGYMHARDIK